MPADQSDSLIGSFLGARYEILARVSRGGTAMVYRGVDRRLGRTVAVKVIHSDLAGDADYIKRFDREARAAAGLAHPNIVAVFDQGHAGDRPYIVMEYVRGQSLRSIISSSAPLHPTRALFYAHEIAKALAAAHEAGIIHRDIKPENVLITNDGQVKVADFGLAKSMTSQTSTASHGVLMGTMSYIPPEIPQTGSATMASDVYSTGVVLYEMLTGKKPHVGEDLTHVLYKHVHEDIPPPSQALGIQARLRIPDYLDCLVTACTSRDIDLRPANGRILEAEISKASRALDEGVMRDPALVEEFTSGCPAAELTPVGPLHSPSTAHKVPAHAADTVTRSEVTEEIPTGTQDHPGATKLAKAPTKAPPHREDPSQPAPGGRPKKTSMAVLILALATLLVVGVCMWWVKDGRWTEVPALTYLTKQEAIELASSYSIKVSVKEEYSETVQAGLVIRSDPGESTRVKRGSQVLVYVSLGPERYPMPAILGMSEDAARKALVDGKLDVGDVFDGYHETAQVGTVIWAEYDPDELLKPGQSVDFTVCIGREPLTVVSVANMSLEEAREKLQAMGFEVTTTEAYSPTVAQGNVISQDPGEGASRYRGDTIALTVSLGPKMIRVPEVRGKSRKDAADLLYAAGFFVDEREVQSIGRPLGLAIGTVPEGGSQAPEGSTIILNIV